jgi:hypothetical protein
MKVSMQTSYASLISKFESLWTKVMALELFDLLFPIAYPLYTLSFVVFET